MTNKSFTLIELLVTVAIFSLIGGIAAGVFTTGLRAQRKSLASQEILSQTSYLMEYISRALRMAKKDVTGDCLGAIYAKYNYAPITDGIRFLNYTGKCQQFFRDGNILKMQVSSDETAVNFGPSLDLTSANLIVNSFNIGPEDSWDQADNDQPRVTIFLEIQGKEQAKIKIQTTVSQRNPDIPK